MDLAEVSYGGRRTTRSGVKFVLNSMLGPTAPLFFRSVILSSQGKTLCCPNTALAGNLRTPAKAEAYRIGIYLY